MSKDSDTEIRAACLEIAAEKHGRSADSFRTSAEFPRAQLAARQLGFVLVWERGGKFLWTNVKPSSGWKRIARINADGSMA